MNSIQSTIGNAKLNSLEVQLDNTPMFSFIVWTIVFAFTLILWFGILLPWLKRPPRHEYVGTHYMGGLEERLVCNCKQTFATLEEYFQHLPAEDYKYNRRLKK